MTSLQPLFFRRLHSDRVLGGPGRVRDLHVFRVDAVDQDRSSASQVSVPHTVQPSRTTPLRTRTQFPHGY